MLKVLRDVILDYDYNLKYISIIPILTTLTITITDFHCKFFNQKKSLKLKGWKNKIIGIIRSLKTSGVRTTLECFRGGQSKKVLFELCKYCTCMHSV